MNIPEKESQFIRPEEACLKDDLERSPKPPQKEERFQRMLEAVKGDRRLLGSEWVEGWVESGGDPHQHFSAGDLEREMDKKEAFEFLAENGKLRRPSEEKLEELEGRGEKERMAIEIITNLPLISQDRLNLLLLYFNKKPATTIDIGFSFPTKRFEGDSAAKEITTKRREIIEENLKRLALLYKIKKADKSKPDYTEHFSHFYIARDRETLRKLLLATEKRSLKKQGLLFGYPETAAKAYAKHFPREHEQRLIRDEEILKQFSLSEQEKVAETLKFLTFLPSRSHWRNELELVKGWQQLVREKAPDLYREIIQ